MEPPLWVVSEYRRDDLNFKKVQCTFTQKGKFDDQIGMFCVTENSSGKLRVQVLGVANSEADDLPHFALIDLGQREVDEIQRVQSPDQPPFRVLICS